MNMWKLPRSFRVAGVAFGAHGVALGSLSALAGLFQMILEKSWILTLCDRRGIWCAWSCSGIAFRTGRAVSSDLGEVLDPDFV